ncbi:MAG TPA: ABC transporter substrate-binding protein [Nitrolancea sp.]
MYNGIVTPLQRKSISRRGFLVAGLGVASAALLQACGGQEPLKTATSASSESTSSSSAATSAATATPSAGGAATPSAASTTAAVATVAPTKPAEVQHKKGGTLSVAIIGEPPVTADAMYTTNFITTDITRQIYEGLFAQDSKLAPKPMLLDAFEVSDDGLTYTFKLRTGVKFHNGTEMNSDDVVASLTRWGTMSGRGKQIFARMAENGLKAVDAQTVTLTLKQPAGVLPVFLALYEGFITPKSVVDAVGTKKIPDDQIIGTGPFKFKEHQVDRYIKLERFEDYSARTDEADGLAGKKVVYIDELDIIPVPNISVATSGVITGEYQFARDVDNNQLDVLKTSPGVTPIIVKPGGWICLNYNKKMGAFTDKKLRQAVSMCFDREQTLIAAYGVKELTRMEPSIAAPETIWYSDAGKDVYEKVDQEAAKKLVQESSYDGSPIRWLTTKEYLYHYNTAAYVQQQMEAIGLKVELVVSDWATVVERRAKPEVYEMLVAGLSGSWMPATQLFNDPTWPGFWVSDQRDQLVGKMIEESDPATLQKTIDEYQALIYDELPIMKIGDSFGLQAIRDEVVGYNAGANDWYFWNCSLK